MVDLTALAGMATSIRAAMEITKAMKDINDANVLQTKTFELTREIMSAQTYAMEAMQAQTDLMTRVRELESKLANLDSWNKEKSRYQLEELREGVVAYSVKPGMENGEPPHHLCPSCFNDQHKSYLSKQHWNPMRATVLVCQDCGAVLYVEGTPHQDHKNMKPAPYRPR
ncbi:hypothetical protein BH10PSE11_BH10PSE11_27520 [soil metagenome]